MIWQPPEQQRQRKAGENMFLKWLVYEKTVSSLKDTDVLAASFRLETDAKQYAKKMNDIYGNCSNHTFYVKQVGRLLRKELLWKSLDAK